MERCVHSLSNCSRAKTPFFHSPVSSQTPLGDENTVTPWDLELYHMPQIQLKML